MKSRRDAGATKENGCGIRSRFHRKQKYLIQAEIYFHVDRYRDWLAVFHGWLEFPLPHSFDSFLVQTQT